jgi:hypothetical protein
LQEQLAGTQSYWCAYTNQNVLQDSLQEPLLAALGVVQLDVLQVHMYSSKATSTVTSVLADTLQIACFCVLWYMSQCKRANLKYIKCYMYRSKATSTVT